ncbi:hypothetical protein BpHYR1_034046 [Brachionus plicatilis]|uniref:C2H2-type domain-containing protein n=1 Tax=Brachionus plicatilis TaxID=10195 RepID=A0A3M7SHY5_BRAPC|nr:hypothetical protein BpHYR1_034046 [Brachionus plicatilis]
MLSNIEQPIMLSSKFKISNVKKKAILCEIKSLEQLKSFDDQMQILSNKKSSIACELCGQFMNGERGIQIHMARKHK